MIKLFKCREEIDKIEEFTQEEKINVLNKISIAESYEYLCLFLIKQITCYVRLYLARLNKYFVFVHDVHFNFIFTVFDKRIFCLETFN